MTIVAFLKSHWSTIAAIVVAIWGAVGTQVQAYVAAHQGATVAIGVIVTILTAISPTPQSFWKGAKS